MYYILPHGSVNGHRYRFGLRFFHEYSANLTSQLQTRTITSVSLQFILIAYNIMLQYSCCLAYPVPKKIT